jgi:hypothetical protein
MDPADWQNLQKEAAFDAPNVERRVNIICFDYLRRNSNRRFIRRSELITRPGLKG